MCLVIPPPAGADACSAPALGRAHACSSVHVWALAALPLAFLVLMLLPGALAGPAARLVGLRRAKRRARWAGSAHVSTRVLDTACVSVGQCGPTNRKQGVKAARPLGACVHAAGKPERGGGGAAHLIFLTACAHHCERPHTGASASAQAFEKRRCYWFISMQKWRMRVEERAGRQYKQVCVVRVYYKQLRQLSQRGGALGVAGVGPCVWVARPSAAFRLPVPPLGQFILRSTAWCSRLS